MNRMYPEGVIGLHHVDGTLLFLTHDIQIACYLKWLMIYCEKLLGMKINYHKSDLAP
jgi:hypothetical protein